MSSQLQVGAAETTINPRLGTQIDGNIGAHRPAEFVLNDLHARTIVFQQDEKRFMLLVMELLAVTEEWTEAVRDYAAGELGFHRDAVAVSVVQNHSSPSMGHIMLSDRFEAARKHPWIRGSDPEYGPMVLDRLKPIMRRAAESVQPARMIFATALESRVSFNRRIAMRDGTSEMSFGGRPQDALYREGVSDPEVGVALFSTPELETVAGLLHHTCHPVHWHPQRAIHSDWPGAWAKLAQERVLGNGIPLVLNGCCGNVHHADVLNPDREDTPESMARLLTEAAHRALCGQYASDDSPRLDYTTARISIPYREFPKELFEDAHRLIDANPEPMWTDESRTLYDREWHFAASMIDLEHLIEETGTFSYQVQALRLGDLAIVVLPGEPFVEAQLDIKQRSPAARTFVAHMANQYVGYIATPEAIRRGGYEVRPWSASKLAPEALQMISDKSVELLGELYA